MTRRGLFRLLGGAAAVPVAAMVPAPTPHWTSPALPWRGYTLVGYQSYRRAGSSKDFLSTRFSQEMADAIYDSVEQCAITAKEHTI